MKANDVSPTPSEGSLWPRTAVILAAGFGSRIQEDPRKIKSKPLIQMGGLSLIERSIQNLAAAGISQIRIVVGAYKDHLVSTLSQLKSLKNFSIEFVDCPDFERGNGASLAAGSWGLEESFLVVMADHVMSPDLIPAFVRKVLEKNPQQLYLATDDDIPNVFDLEDATKIWVEDERIVRIGKSLREFNQVDTGLFYFPRGAARDIGECHERGLNSVSEIVDAIKDKYSFRAQVISPLSFWQDVDTPQMAREAEKRLLKSLVSQEDGWISRYINRPISLRLSLVLSRWHWHPNVITTIVLLVSLLSAGVAHSGGALWVAVAGILFQLASVLDGCDGEVARMTFRQTKWGAWYDTLTHHVRYAAFFLGLGLGLWKRGGGPSLYLLGSFIFVLFLVHLVIRMLRFEYHIEAVGNHQVVSKAVISWGEETQSTFGAWLVQLRNLVKQDFVAFLGMIFCVLGGAGIFFWMACIGLVLVTIVVDHALATKDSMWVRGALHSLLGTELSFLFFASGAALMVWIYGYFPLSASFSSYLASPEYLWGLVAVPWLWFGLNAYALSRFLGRGVGIVALLTSQIVGEALNALVPISGMMVEPVKARYLCAWVPAPAAHRGIFEERVLHIAAGLSLATLLGMGLVFLTQLAWSLKTLLFLVSILSAGLALYLLRIFSDPRVAERVTRLLAQLRLASGPAPSLFYPRSLVFRVWLAKLAGRAMSMVEIALLFAVLGLRPELFPVAMVMAAISFSSIVGFWIPQGLGLHELAVMGVFRFLNLPTELAVVFCALRRLRMIGFSALGVSLLLKQFTFEKVKNRVQNYS